MPLDAPERDPSFASSGADAQEAATSTAAAASAAVMNRAADAMTMERPRRESGYSRPVCRGSPEPALP